MRRIKIKRVLTAVLADLALIISAIIIFLCFIDICEPTQLYINATDTGNLLCPSCVVIFAGAVVYISYRLGDRRCAAARGGIVLGVLPHAVMVLSLLFEVLTVTNFFNHSMEFLTSDISKAVLLVYATLSLLMSLALIDCAACTKE